MQAYKVLSMIEGYQSVITARSDEEFLDTDRSKRSDEFRQYIETVLGGRAKWKQPCWMWCETPGELAGDFSQVCAMSWPVVTNRALGTGNLHAKLQECSTLLPILVSGEEAQLIAPHVIDPGAYSVLYNRYDPSHVERFIFNQEYDHKMWLWRVGSIYHGVFTAGTGPGTFIDFCQRNNLTGLRFDPVDWVR